MRQVNEVILLRPLAEKTSNVFFDFVKLNWPLAPGANVSLVLDPKLRARKIPVSQLKAGRQKPAAPKSNVEDRRILISGQQLPHQRHRLQDLRLPLHFAPRN